MRIRFATRNVSPAIRFTLHAVLILVLVIIVLVHIRLIVAMQAGRGAGGRGCDIRSDCRRGLGLIGVVAIGERVAAGRGLLLLQLHLLSKLVWVLLVVRCLSGVI